MRSLSKSRLRSELDRCRTEARKLNMAFNEASAHAITVFVVAHDEYTRPSLALLRDGRIGLKHHSYGCYIPFGDRP